MPVQVAMSGARKAAILLLTLGEDPSSEVCKHLREEEIEAIIKEDPFYEHHLADFRIIEFRASQRADDIQARLDAS